MRISFEWEAYGLVGGGAGFFFSFGSRAPSGPPASDGISRKPLNPDSMVASLWCWAVLKEPRTSSSIFSISNLPSSLPRCSLVSVCFESVGIEGTYLVKSPVQIFLEKFGNSSFVQRCQDPPLNTLHKNICNREVGGGLRISCFYGSTVTADFLPIDNRREAEIVNLSNIVTFWGSGLPIAWS